MGFNTKTVMHLTQYINEIIQIWHKMVQDIYIHTQIKIKTCQSDKTNAIHKRKRTTADAQSFASKSLMDEHFARLFSNNCWERISP